MTYTYALMEVSKQTYDEINAKLIKAGYAHAVSACGELDMHGIALVTKREPDPKQLNEFCKNPPCASSTCRRLRTCVHE